MKVTACISCTTLQVLPLKEEVKEFLPAPKEPISVSHCRDTTTDTTKPHPQKITVLAASKRASNDPPPVFTLLCGLLHCEYPTLDIAARMCVISEAES